MNQSHEQLGEEVKPEVRNRDLGLEELMRQILANIQNLRGELRNKVQEVMAYLPDINSKFTGDAYVENVGSIVHFERGNYNFFYEPTAITMRDDHLRQQQADRRKFFGRLASQFGANSRILNIGAGGDVDLIQEMQGAGHEIISTDFSQSTVNVLKNRTDTPVFAGDLIHLDTIVPAKAVDFFVGNSTLGYVEPAKVKKVVENIVKSMIHGGVFSFDLSPHPFYFDLIVERDEQTVLNQSAPDPAKLLELVEKYGVQNGINAMALHWNFRTKSVQIAVLQLLRNLFEEKGLKCVTGVQTLRENMGHYVDSYTLRVSKDADEILNPVEGEHIFQNADEEWTRITSNTDRLGFLLNYIDREQGQKLAKAFGIQTTDKLAPWKAAGFAYNNMDPAKLPTEIGEEVRGMIHLDYVLEKILPFVDGAKPPQIKPLSHKTMLDQSTHSRVLQQMFNEGDFNYELIEREDRNLDIKLAKLENEERIAEEESRKELMQKNLDKAAKEKRKKEKVQKKKNRK